MSDRKHDHIDLAFRSQTEVDISDKRFIYEPMLSAHPTNQSEPLRFLNKELELPVWVSSMTGGTKLAGIINENIARVCKDFGMGMGLGSCRILLESDEYFSDFNVRKFIGNDLPLYANLGIAQIESFVESKQYDKVKYLLDSLKADGLIIHVNPLQEWFQPEGNIIHAAPIDTISIFLENIDFPVIVKEVGQGMGSESLRRLLQLPLQAIEFGAFGGTNFSVVELLRGSDYDNFIQFGKVGEDAESMVNSINKIVAEEDVACKEIIISGGIRNFLDGYYLMEKSSLKAIYGQASSILKHAKESYEQLFNYIDTQKRGLQLAKSYLRLNPEQQ